MHEYRPTETAIRRSSQKKSGCEAGGGFMYRAGLAIAVQQILWEGGGGTEPELGEKGERQVSTSRGFR